jgi:pseudouridine-5'-phosphate glycosidase
MKFKFNEEVADALRIKNRLSRLNQPSSLTVCRIRKTRNRAELEKIVRENGAIPATIAVFDGEFASA